jgi:hypothetical protein
MSDEPVLAAIARLETVFDASLGEVRADMRASLGDVQADMRPSFGEVRADVRASLGEVQADMRASLGEVRADMHAEMTQMRTVIMDRIDRLQDRVTEIRDDIGVAMGSADAMQRANDNTREIVRLQGEQMSIMFRQIKRLEDKVRNITGES